MILENVQAAEADASAVEDRRGSCAEEGSIGLWIKQLKDGDSAAAHRLWERYCNRLIGLARKKLQDGPRRVADEEDVVQIAFASFCQQAQAGLLPDLGENNLWPLLALITARKAANLWRQERRAKRGGGQVESWSEECPNGGTLAALLSGKLSPDDEAVFFEQWKTCMDLLKDPTHRMILLWKLEDRTNPEIARHLDCSLTSVERALRLIRKHLHCKRWD